MINTRKIAQLKKDGYLRGNETVVCYQNEKELTKLKSCLKDNGFTLAKEPSGNYKLSCLAVDLGNSVATPTTFITLEARVASCLKNLSAKEFFEIFE